MSARYRFRLSAGWICMLAVVNLLILGCASRSPNGAAPSVTRDDSSSAISLASSSAQSSMTTPAGSSSPPTATGTPGSASSTGSPSTTRPSGRHPTSPPTTRPTHPKPVCSATATGSIGGRKRQAIAFQRLGTDHQWPDNEAALVACSSSGLPVSFALTANSSNCQLSSASSGMDVVAQQVVADCAVMASQGGNSEYAPAAQVTQPYVVNSLLVTVRAAGPTQAVSLTQGTQSFTVTLSGEWPFVLDTVGFQARPDETVCSPPASWESLDTGSRHSITKTFAATLHATGSCDIQISAGDSQYVLITTGIVEVQFTVKP